MTDETSNENEAPVSDDWADAMQEQQTAEQAEAPASQDDIDALLDDPKEPAEQNAEPSEESFMPSTVEDSQEGEALFSADADSGLDVILDIPVTVSMEIGRTQMAIRSLLQLNQGSVVELERLAGEPMDVLVNGTLIAHGEVVVVNEKFGIRLTDVISPAERVQKLK